MGIAGPAWPSATRAGVYCCRDSPMSDLCFAATEFAVGEMSLLIEGLHGRCYAAAAPWVALLIGADGSRRWRAMLRTRARGAGRGDDGDIGHRGRRCSDS